MILPLINVFQNVYEVYELPPEPVFENGSLRYRYQGIPKWRISDPYEAAMHMATVLVDNGLESHIDNYLSNSPIYKIWRRMMPNRTPKIFLQYQNSYSRFDDMHRLETELIRVNALLSVGQVLFHGGYWCYGKELILSEPLSTSFSPQIALRNGEHLYKAYDRGYLDLWVITTRSSVTPVFSFRIDSRNRMGREKEVLLNSEAKLTLKSITNVRTYNVAHYSTGIEKTIMVRIIYLDLDNYN
ncbi:hypothetical protein NYR68_11170 [Actinobacillus equuli subsp. haemolyticus]|uniref:hypothetical protein n=1 Tax=Actinobacillus equuli TaxID=718 RepID=UPI0024466597|nr:hypothetical protein [Actinobacillus equuli]WGE50790.1 hypothetical protein NYR68_11170 [Actinobacillus equuli subsp. haemolyticus]